MTFLKIIMMMSFFSPFHYCHVQCHDNFSNASFSVVALILARGGSKGIKLKNIQKIDGVTLLGISLTEIQRTSLFESIWVSTDHEDIAIEAEKCELFAYCIRFFLFVSFFKTRQTSIGEIQNMLRINQPRSMLSKNFFEIIHKFKTWLSFNARLHSFPIDICKKLFANSHHPIIVVVIVFSLQSEATNCDGSVMMLKRHLKNLFQSILTFDKDHDDKIGMVSWSKRECFILQIDKCLKMDYFRMKSN